jgi:competence ComEA-like helix-hairpin-helix protein
MKFRGVVRDHLAFTRQETLAIAFLSIALLAGQAVRWYRSSIAPAGKETDYAALDSEFIARARADLLDVSRDVDSVRRLPSPPPLARASVNINSATLDQLVALPGIGPATAEKILEYRKNNGPFQSTEDLLEVSGIGPKKLAQIRPYIRLEEPAPTLR